MEAPSDTFRPGSTLVRNAMFGVQEAEPEQTRSLPPGTASLAADGSVYLAQAGRGVRVLDPETGAERWSASLESPELGAPVSTPQGTLWVCGAGVLAAFDEPTGRTLGTWETGARFPLSPVAGEGGRVLVGNWGGRGVAALDPACPEPLWTAPVGYTSQPVASAPGQVLVSLCGAAGRGVIQSLDSETGAPLWVFETDSGFSSPPVPGPDGTIFAAGHGGTVHALDPATGRPLWERPAGGKVYTSPTPSPDGTRVYVGTFEKTVSALDAATGERLWTVETGAPVRVSPAVDEDGLLCVVDEGGRALLVEPTAGLPLLAVDLGFAPSAAPVALAPGRFTVTDRLGRVHRIAEPPPEAALSIEKAAAEVRIGGISLPIQA